MSVACVLQVEHKVFFFSFLVEKRGTLLNQLSNFEDGEEMNCYLLTDR